MRLKSYVVLAIALVPLSLVAQTPVKSAAKSTPASASAPLSDQERNFRAYIQLMRADLRKEKAQVTGAVMQLDAEDASKFWPIYKDFEAELSQIYDGVAALIKSYAMNYDSMTASVADQLAGKVLDLEQQRNELKRRYYDKFKAGLDSTTALRFLQIENQIERLLDLQIASQLPVVSRSQQ
jgi:predicted nucleotidyltransferase component of viral defense system